MKKILVTILASALPMIYVNANDDSNLIGIEDFSRFDIGKPACFAGKIEIKEENGNHTALILANHQMIIPFNNFMDIGAYGTDYSFETRFRFNDPGNVGGVRFTYNNYGKRNELKYNNYSVRFERGSIAVAYSASGADQNNPNIVKPLNFMDADMPQFKENRWYTFKIDVMPEKGVIYVDIREEGKLEKLIEYKANYGTGRYTLVANQGAEFDYYKITALATSDKTSAPAEVGESAVGPTNAAEQAEKTAQGD